MVFTLKLPQVFEKCIPVILALRADYFRLSLSLLTEVISFKYTPVFGLLMRVTE